MRRGSHPGSSLASLASRESCRISGPVAQGRRRVRAAQPQSENHGQKETHDHHRHDTSHSARFDTTWWRFRAVIRVCWPSLALTAPAILGPPSSGPPAGRALTPRRSTDQLCQKRSRAGQPAIVGRNRPIAVPWPASQTPSQHDRVESPSYQKRHAGQRSGPPDSQLEISRSCLWFPGVPPSRAASTGWRVCDPPTVDALI